MMRLNKFLAHAGLGSRRHCDTLIEQGGVYINGSEVNTPAVSVDPAQDRITYQGRELTLEPETVYIMLNKPMGVVCTMNDDRPGRRSLPDLVKTPQRCFPVGRLDKNSRGLLLLTNDGDYAQKLAHPSGEKRKYYRVRVKGSPSAAALSRLREPIHIDGRSTQPARVDRVRHQGTYTTFRVTLAEGRNRQIRQLLRRAGLELLDLYRERIGRLVLDIPEGQWRHLSPAESRLALSGP